MSHTCPPPPLQPSPSRREDRPVSFYQLGSGAAPSARDAAGPAKDKPRAFAPSIVQNETYGAVLGGSPAPGPPAAPGTASAPPLPPRNVAKGTDSGAGRAAAVAGGGGGEPCSAPTGGVGRLEEGGSCSAFSLLSERLRTWVWGPSPLSVGAVLWLLRPPLRLHFACWPPEGLPVIPLGPTPPPGPLEAASVHTGKGSVWRPPASGVPLRPQRVAWRGGLGRGQAHRPALPLRAVPLAVAGSGSVMPCSVSVFAVCVPV